MSVCLSRPTVTLFCLVAADALAFGISLGATTFVGRLGSGGYLALWPFLCVFLGLCYCLGLYSIVALQPVAEIRRCTFACILLFPCMAGLSVTLNGGSQAPWWIWLASGAVCAGLLPLIRAGIRRLCARRSWWGYPAVVFGGGQFAERLVENMRNDPAVGLKLIAVFEDCKDVPSAAALLRGQQGYAVIASNASHLLTDHCRAHFSHVLVVPSLGELGGQVAYSRHLGGRLGIELRRG